PNAFTPSGTSTQTDKREVALVASGAKIGNQINITINWRAADYTGAAYNVGSIGFYAGDPLAGGILFAVISAPDRASPARGGGSVANYTQTYTLTLSGVPEGSVSVSIDPDATVAMAALSAHIAATNPHPQYVRKAGDTMTGALLLHANATAPMQAVPLQQLSSAATHEALLGLNGWVKTPIQSPAGGHLIEQWVHIPIPGGDVLADAGNLIYFAFPEPVDGLIGIWPTIMGADATWCIAMVEDPTLVGAVLHVQQVAAYTQVGTYVRVLIKGYIGPSVPFGLVPPAPPAPPVVASFTHAPNDHTLNPLTTVTFTDTSTGTPTAWLWDFGDGTTSTLQNPTKTYPSVGVRVVSLTASNASGSSIAYNEVAVVGDGGGAGDP
ncbi:MAG: PKD domain-containing protein, partial [Hydrogenophaga sp.]|nr:PKD domain-containing protein [Hydrogenophaga sp.]